MDCLLLDEEEGGRLTRFASVEQRGALAALEIRFGGFDRYVCLFGALSC